VLKLTTTVHEEAALTKILLAEIELKQASSQCYDALLDFLRTLCNEVLELTNSVLDYLKTTPKPIPEHEELLRNWLVLGSYVVRQINNYCDSFEYAEVLSVPTAMMQLLNRLFRQVTKNKEFIVRGTASFNYTYQPIGQSLNKLASRFPSDKTPKLEDSFAIITFPLLYGKSVMANCNLVHELGHLIADSMDLNKRLDDSLSVEKRKKITEIIEQTVLPPGGQVDFGFAQRKKRANMILENWIHETMADYIGILLLGPCTLFAFMKLMEPLASHQTDDDEHPCNSSRVGMMLEILEVLKWDKVINQECPEILKRAKDLSGLERAINQTNEYNAAAICLPIVKEEIFEIVRKLCKTFTYKPQAFRRFNDTVNGLLERGIPPAEKMGDGTTIDKFVKIDAVSILNSGWFFYENNYPSWEERFSKFEAVERAAFLNRLIAKAIEITFIEEPAS